MKTLILNIDRDDDFGRKAKVKTPIIGIEDNMDAAQKLGCVDPEDSDLNSIYLAIATYQTFLHEGTAVEIATICGDIRVGVKSDTVLAKQLDHVIAETKVTDVVVVSDGAEDEYIIPLIQSRISISSIRRVNVKQSRELEDTYYRIIKMLNDDKVKKQIVFPVAMLLLVGAIFIALRMVSTGIGAILFTLGLYLLVHVFNLEKKISVVLKEIRSGFFAARISFYTSIISIIILGVSVFYSWEITRGELGIGFFIFLLAFLQSMVWGIVASGLVFTLGKFLDEYIRKKRIFWSYWVIPFSLFAFGFITSAAFESLYISLYNNFSIEPFFTFSFWSYMITGVLLAFIGSITYHYIRDIYHVEDTQQDREGMSSQPLKEN